MHESRNVQRSLTKDALTALMQAFIHRRLDYCNALLVKTAEVEIKHVHSRKVSGA